MGDCEHLYMMDSYCEKEVLTQFLRYILGTHKSQNDVLWQ